MLIGYYKTTLSLDEIHSIMDTTQDSLLLAKMTKLSKKITADLIKPAYVRDDTPKESLLESLGGKSEEEKATMYENDSPEDWLAADPNIPDVSPTDL